MFEICESPPDSDVCAMQWDDAHVLKMMTEDYPNYFALLRQYLLMEMGEDEFWSSVEDFFCTLLPFADYARTKWKAELIVSDVSTLERMEQLNGLARAVNEAFTRRDLGVLREAVFAIDDFCEGLAV